MLVLMLALATIGNKDLNLLERSYQKICKANEVKIKQQILIFFL